MSKSKSRVLEVYTAVTATDGDDELALQTAIGAIITEALIDDGRDQAKKNVYFHSTDVNKTMVINEVEGRIEDEFIDGDVHLVKVKIAITLEYL